MSLDPAASTGSSRDSAVSALTTLSNVAQGHISGVMVIAQGRSEPPVVSQLRPTERALPVLNGVVQDAASVFANSELIEYGPATSTSDGQIMWISAAAVPLLKPIVDESTDLAVMPLFDPSKSKLTDLKLAAIRVGTTDDAAVFVQSLRGNQIVAQSRRVGVIVRKGVIDLPRRGQMLLFSREVAAVIVGDVALFQDRPGFQRLFGYLDDLRRQADATFRSVTSDLRIMGFEQMAATVASIPAMLGKMASIQHKVERFPQYRQALTMPRLVEFVQQHPECEVEIVGHGENAQLAFRNDPQHRFKILKLLDDDYLRSELTKLGYEANSKGAPVGSA